MGHTLFAPAPVSLFRRRPPVASSWEATLAACFDRHGPAVFGLAERVTRDPDVASRLTAEVFAELTEVTDEAALAECILTAVHRRAVDWVRSTTRLPAAGFGQDALVALDAAEREVISAAYFDGLTYTEIAQRLGLPLTQVASLMQQGLRRLAAFNAPAASAS